ncbi:40S ribosomal protein S27-2 [Citrus sinensis]|nr:40S ribosomal protein S27-2 [Citrus sinensis]
MPGVQLSAEQVACVNESGNEPQSRHECIHGPQANLAENVGCKINETDANEDESPSKSEAEMNHKLLGMRMFSRMLMTMTMMIGCHILTRKLLLMVLQNDIDLLNPPAELEMKKHKLKRLVQSPNSFFMVLQNDIDLLNPPAELEKKKHKLKRLVQSPNSFFMDVKCQGCFNITTVFSHSQTVVVCGNCQSVLCQPTGGRARLTEGCSFRRKGD